ncbi:SMP-30/gluconolactonase/LRE family protein [Roseibium aggregatum]|uniref:SMP-30/gluconolactonase/LRE family protein n=1 Tax=Roseibium aggregatum TaxID=187304 RepID=A0A939J676_9HYPH|nr:SMP-30/gluconolactonase/LRE family protein [Roseibium aggregatum]MBN9672990.1 SMP-30/gluconolactonase/LRE family protein [Roseibium aggregatum]
MPDLHCRPMRAGLLTAGFYALTLFGSTAFAEDCAPVNGAEFICGVDNVEDFVRLPDGRILGSDLAQYGQQGHFWLFGTDRSVLKVQPEDIAIAPDPDFAGCPGAPDWSVFGPHGLDLVASGDTATLLAVNHGGREAIEMFKIDLAGKDPKFSWTGCLIAPPGAWPDDVAILPDGGVIATSLWDTRDDTRVEKLNTGKPVGGLFEWHPDKGWSPVKGAEAMSGPNGVVVTPDGSTAYVAAWSGKQLFTVDRTTGEITAQNVDFAPDNLVWSADGSSILIGGVITTVPDVLACFVSQDVNCPALGVRVDRLNPETGEFKTLVKGNDYGQFGAATGAIEVDDELWVNSFRSDRIAIFELP